MGRLGDRRVVASRYYFASKADVEMRAEPDTLAASSGESGTSDDRQAGQDAGGSTGETTNPVVDEILGSKLDPVHDWNFENEVHNRLEKAGALERRFPESQTHLKTDQSDMIMTTAMKATAH